MAKWTATILNNPLPLSISLIVLIPVHLTDTIEEKRNKTSLLSHLTKPLFTTHCSRVHYSELIYGLYVVLITGFNCVTVLPGWRLGGDCSSYSVTIRGAGAGRCSVEPGPLVTGGRGMLPGPIIPPDPWSPVIIIIIITLSPSSQRRGGRDHHFTLYSNCQ